VIMQSAIKCDLRISQYHDDYPITLRSIYESSLEYSTVQYSTVQYSTVQYTPDSPSPSMSIFLSL
jgi:hypothetical protein